MVYVDELIAYPQAPKPGAERHFGNGKESCHMATDGELEELHRFAEALGLDRRWVQHTSVVHYDLTPATRARAVQHGAREITTTELIQRCRKTKSPAAR